MTTSVSRQAVDDCLQGEQARYEVCHRPIEVVKGHRTRRYCSDSCKQKFYQGRKAAKENEARRAQLCATYPDFGKETIDLLDGFAALKNQEMVERIAAAIARERNASKVLSRYNGAFASMCA